MNNNDYLDVIKNGKLYYPASSHYDMINDVPVQCNRCYINDLKICIGYLDKDLCLECCEKIVNSEGFKNKKDKKDKIPKYLIANAYTSNKVWPIGQINFKYLPKAIKYQPIMTAIVQDIFNTSIYKNMRFEPYVTRMCQDIFNIDKQKHIHGELTWMNQDIFKKKNPIKLIANSYTPNKVIKDYDLYPSTSTIEISHICLQSNPCKHDVTISGIKSKMSGKQIANKYWKYLDEKQKIHFEKYKSKNLV